MYRWTAVFFFFIVTSSLSAEEISYNRDVRPILSENCFLCHGFDKDKREGDLRLDTFGGATEKRDGLSAIVPGKPNESNLIKRIFTTDEAKLMPPSDSAYFLTDKQKETLTKWIEQGAQYDEHWAFKELKRPTRPDSKLHPVDSFLKQTWENTATTKVEKADPRSLLRRLSYDLRGLPPTFDEVSQFEKNPTKEQYLSFVDKWITSLEHAEHQGLLWLDLVRWADSNGMVSDEPIASGPFRKYVIEAFQNNMPFDQFTREQLAGDLVEEVTDQTLTASAYNRLVKTNCEAGVIEKEALYALKGEHVRAVGTVWLGLTTGCAECHDHKYDPITAKDYYSLAAFFDDLQEAGVYQPGDRRVPLHYIHESPSKSQKEMSLVSQIDQVQSELYDQKIDTEKLAIWSKDILKESKVQKKKKGRVDWPWFPIELPVTHIQQGDFEQTENGRKVVAQSPGLTRHLAGESLSVGVQGKNHAFYTEAFIDPEDPPTAIGFQVIHGAYRRMGWLKEHVLTYYWGPKDDAAFLSNAPWLSKKKLVHMGELPEVGKMVRLEVPRAKFAKSKYVPQAMAWLQSKGTVTWGESGYVTDHGTAFNNRMAESVIRYFWELPLNRDDREDLPTMLVNSLRKKEEDRRWIHTHTIETAFREHMRPDLVKRLTALYKEAYLHRLGATETLVSKADKPKVTHVLNRGSFMEEVGEPVEPAIPEIFGTLEKGRRLTRLDLANWIVSRDNPLTARVWVNRLWHQFYGRGISETLEDSGNQGDWPSHLSLLDWLAMEFVESGWDMRHMIRLMVTSDAYQISSVATKESVDIDPTNRLHARQGRSRLTGEEIRDTALSAAGLIDYTKEIPSESFYPYQPDAYWVKSNKIMYGSRYLTWDTSTGAGQYQRSLYTFWKRQNIHPAMLAFDAPTRQECVPGRTVTNTPAQALALLNDPQFVEAARNLASRILTESDEQNRIETLYKIVLQRLPSDEEKNILQSAYTAAIQRFSDHPKEAQDLLSIGLSPRSDLDPIEHAAWTATCRILLNLHEFITRP